MFKKTFVVLTVLSLATLFVSSVALGGAKRTVSLMIWNAEGWIRGHNELLPQFERRYPDVKTQLVIGDNQKFLVSIAGGAPPDIYFASYDYFQVYSSEGTFLDVTPYAAKDPEFKESDYIEKIIDATKYKGRLYGLPQTYSPILAFYNRGLFDKEGVEYPTEKWGWDDLISNTKKLTKDFDGDGNMDQFGITHRGGYHRFPLWIGQNGGRMWTDSEPRRSTFDEPKTIEALQFYTDLVRKYRVAPSLTERAPGISGVDATQLFGTGRAAIDYTTRYYAPPEGMNWDVSSLWHGPGGWSSILIINYYAVTSYTKSPQEAWDLMRFLSYNHKVELLNKTFRAVPPIKEEATRLLTHPGQPPEHDMAFLTEVPKTSVLYYPSKIFKEFNETIDKNLELALRGNIDVPEAARRMAKDINDALKARGL
jgi:multiple sugar transport system substrate-binding protein